MPNDQKIIELAAEYLLYINIPEPFLKFLFKMRPRLSAAGILLYLNYWLHWRYGEYALTVTNQDLATQIQMDVSSVKRGNGQLIDAGLIKRIIRKRTLACGTVENKPSITLPSVPEQLKAELQGATMRKPYRHETHGQVTSFGELLGLLAEEANTKKEDNKLTVADIKQRIAQLFSDNSIDQSLYTEHALGRQVAWSIFEGQLSVEEYLNDEKRLNIAIRLIRERIWKKPKGFPTRWGLNVDSGA